MLAPLALSGSRRVGNVAPPSAYAASGLAACTSHKHPRSSLWSHCQQLFRHHVLLQGVFSSRLNRLTMNGEVSKAGGDDP